MVQKIIWTQKAHEQKIEIFQYWNAKNGSDTFSLKLNQLINKAVNLISKFPKLGVKTQIENVRVKPVKDYLLIYRFEGNVLYILLVWDSRQNPNDLSRFLNLQQ